MKLDPNTDFALMEIISLYYDKENFLINNFNLELLDKIYQILSQLNLKNLLVKTESNAYTFFLDFNILKSQNPENFLVLMKYIQTFGEESLTFIKCVVHYYMIKIEKMTISSKIILRMKNEKELFLVESTQKLKVNSYVQLYCTVTNVSPLKIFNTKLNYICSNCGVIATKNLLFNNVKNVNAIFHQCENGKDDNIKITKEYIESIYIRYINVECKGENILCMIDEENFNMSLLDGEVKISGVVKARNENEKNENFYIKYINIIQVEEIPKNKNFTSLNFDDLKIQIANFKSIKSKFSFCYNKLLQKIDYLNILLFYYLFSLSQNQEYNLKLQCINLTKNDLSNYSSIQRIQSQFPHLFKVIQNELTLSNNNQNNKNLNSFKKENEYYTNFTNDHLVIMNNENKSSSLEVKNILRIINYPSQYFNSNYINNSTSTRSILSFSESFDVNVNGYDIITISHEMNNLVNDRKKSNMIISNQFAARKKRNYQTSMKMEETQINKVDKVSNFSEDLFTLDSLSIIDYFKNEIILEEENNIINRILPNIEDYIDFVNKYINPIIPKEAYNDIYFLTEHLKNQFKDLENYVFFDINWITISTLVKLAKISARIEMREQIIKEDIVKAYLITKEFLQQNYVYYLLNKKEKVKGKKAKIYYIMEKLRQFSLTNGKKINSEQIKSFGCFDEEEYNALIDKLNYEGILIKIKTQEFKIYN